MSRNGRQQPARPRIEVRQGAASPEEAAAIAAAIEEFLSDTAPAPSAPGPSTGAWTRAALLEGAGLAPAGPRGWDEREPWGSS